MLTKTDLLDGKADGLVERLAAINPSATLLMSSLGDVDAGRLFDIGLDTAAGKRTDLRPWLGLAEHSRNGRATHDHASHDVQISYFAIRRQEPIRAHADTPLEVWLNTAGATSCD